MNKRSVAKQLRRQVNEVRADFPELKGVIIYGSFPYPGSRPNDVDLLLVFDRYLATEEYVDIDYVDKIHRILGLFRNSDPNYHVNDFPLFLKDPTTEFGLQQNKYIFIGNRTTRRIIRGVYPSAEEVRI